MHLHTYVPVEIYDLGLGVFGLAVFLGGGGGGRIKLVKGTILFVFSKVILTMFESRKRTEHLEDRCSARAGEE